MLVAEVISLFSVPQAIYRHKPVEGTDGPKRQRQCLKTDEPKN